MHHADMHHTDMHHTSIPAPRAVHSVVDMPLHRFDARTSARQFHSPVQALIDPFLGVDVFDMPHPFFLPHPHGGMSAVTVLLAHSPGGVVNRDSRGDHSTIAPGDLHWTQAGRGIVHEETPSQPGQSALGLQVFVNMARAHKQAEAAVFKVARADMPVWQPPGARVTVVAGALDGLNALASPIAAQPDWLTRVDILDIRLQPGAALWLPLAAHKNGFLLVLSGAVQVAGQDAGQAGHQAHAHQAVVLQPAPALAPTEAGGPPGRLHLQAGGEGAHLVLMAGVPLREPVVPHGPFVGNTRDDIVAYIGAYQAGRMGSLEPSFSR